MKMHPNLFSLGMIGFYMLASTLLTTPAKHHNPKFSKNPVQSQALIAPGTIINWSNPLMLIKNKAIFPPAPKQAIHPDFWSNPVEVLAKGNFLFAPNITATKSDFLFTDNGAVGATPGDVIEYTIIITNSGAMDATGVSFTDQIDPNTTLVPGSDNASPLARDDSYSAIGNVGINVNTIVGGLLGNDEDPDADALTVTAVNTAGTQGTVAFNGDGTFTFTPAAGFEGNTTFTYTISDGTVTDVATVTISVNGMIWFINNASVAGTEDGRLNTPYKSIANFQAVNNGTGSNPAAGDVIFIHQGSGNYTGPLTLLNTQKLIGEGASATLASITGFTVPPFSNPLPTTTLANKPVITAAGTNHAITLGQNNLIRGLTVGNTADGAKIFGNDFGTATIGNVTTPDVMLNGTGKALDLTTGTLAAYFAELTSTSSPTAGVNLTTVGGTLSSLSTTGGISGSTNIGFSVNGSNPTITYAAPISKSASGKVVDIRNTTGNTISFTNTVTATASSSGINLNDVNGNVTFSTLNLGTSVTRLSAGPAINIVNGTGTYNLGTIAVFTNGITALSASGADGTLNITTGTIDATSGTAVSIDGPAGLTTLGISLEKVSSTNATNGIFIQDTNGSFTVTGNTMTNANGSGGAISGISQRGVSLSSATGISLSNMTISNMTGDAGGAGTCDATTSVGCFGAVHMNNVTTVSLTNVDISTSNEQGIVGNEVSGLTITNSTVDNIGNGIAGGDPNECAVYLRDLKGTCSITNSNFTNADTRLFHLINSSETLNLTINNCDFTDLKTAGQGEDALEMQFLNACNTTLSITNSEFRRYRTYGIQIQTLNTSTTTATITDNQVLQDVGVPGQGIELTGSGTSSVNYTVNNNTVNYRNGNGIGILTIANATSNGKIIGNTITGPGADVTGIGIRVGAEDDSDGINLIQNNTLNNVGFNIGILAFATKVDAGATGNATLNTTIDNNNVNTVANTSGTPIAIEVRAGSGVAGETPVVCANVKNNDVVVAGTFFAFRPRTSTAGATLNLAEALGTATIANYWATKGNTPGGGPFATGQVGTLNFVAGSCTTPPPLMENPVVMLNPPATDPKPVEAAPLEVVETPAPADTEVITDTNVPTASAKADKGGNPPVQKSLLFGETVTINGSGSGFTLKPGESTTIKFRVTINAAPHMNANCQISNQGMVSGNFTTVMTDDPDTGAPNDATLTPLVPPTANFSGTPLTGCVPLQVSFTDASTSNGGTINSWAWDIDNDGDIDYTTQNPMHIYTAPGMYMVKLTVTDNLGCTDTEIKTNYVNAAEPEVNIAVAPTPVAENSGTAMVFTVTRTGSTDCELTIPFTITGTAVEGTDYPDVVPTSFTIPAGMTTAMLSITPTNDNIVEANETIIITLTDGSNYSVGANNSATGTITNDDQAVISIAATTQAAEDATDGLFTITSTKAFDADVTVNFMVTGTASSGTDYTSIGTSVVLPANMTTVTIPVDVLLDAIVEADETVIVTLTSVSNAAGSVAMPINNSATVTITDNDAATISFTAVPSQNEGDVGMSGFNFDVTLGAVVDDAVTVTFATMDGTATIADLDYQTNTNTITFPANGAGQTQTITIQVNGDTDSEQDETFKVMLSNIVVGTGRDVTFAGGGATLSGTGTILNDDQPPVIINEVDADQIGTDAAEFIELYDGGTGNTPLDGLVLVLYNGANDQSYAAFDLDGFTTNATGYFIIGNAAVPGVDIIFAGNTLQNGPDAVALYAANGTDFPNGTAITTGNLLDAIVYDANTDPDDAGLLVLLNAAQPQVDEDANGSPTCHSMQRIPNGSGGARNTNAYVAVPPTPDAANAVPEVTISVSADVTEDGATNLTYTITRTGSTCSALSVPFTVTGTADGSDYTINVTSPINIPAGMSSATITVDPTADGTVEPNETVIITLTDASASNAYNLGTPAAATGTINNDDATTVVSIVRADPNPTNAASVDWTVTFSSPMTGVSASNFTLVPGGSVAGATITNVMGSGTTWTVTASTGTGDGTLGLNMTNSTGATDAAGNGPTNLTFVGEVYDIDKTAPTVTIDQAAGQVDPTNMSPIVFTVQFSEAVTDFDDASDITLSGTAGATTVVIIPVDADTYTVQVSGMTSDGTVIATVIA
ncbi:MAG: Calx-beta domain-containing protein, partial [Saprospiraceae bacterium]